MRLAEVLSKPPTLAFEQVESFLGDKILKAGKQRKINAGKISLNYFCNNCNDVRTFCSGEELYCIGVNEHLVSIDCVLNCIGCNSSSVQMWFLVDSKDDIWGHAPEVRVLRRREKLSSTVQVCKYNYGSFSELLEKAEQAHRDGLGAGAVIYLRKIFEQITSETATASGIPCTNGKGNRKNFKDLLEDVDKHCSIIPREFSANGYKLFGELSEIVHGGCDEELALSKYESLCRLTIGILDNVKNNNELMAAIKSLGWNDGGGS